MKKEKEKNERFEKVYSQGGMFGMEIWADKETGVQYLFGFSGYAGGLTVLLDADGRPALRPAGDKTKAEGGEQDV